jgi:hypothetical protein
MSLFVMYLTFLPVKIIHAGRETQFKGEEMVLSGAIAVHTEAGVETTGFIKVPHKAA